MASRAKSTVVQEGPEAATRFEGAIDRLLRVSKADLDAREAKYQAARAAKIRPGPKPIKK